MYMGNNCDCDLFALSCLFDKRCYVFGALIDLIKTMRRRKRYQLFMNSNEPKACKVSIYIKLEMF